MKPPPLKWSPQGSLGAFPFALRKNWRGGIHKSTPQPRGKSTVKQNSERKIPRKSLENQRLFTWANLVLRLAWDSISQFVENQRFSGTSGGALRRRAPHPSFIFPDVFEPAMKMRGNLPERLIAGGSVGVTLCWCAPQYGGSVRT